MTATPIPRTLALARYGDLDTSRLRELPAGRRPVLTEILSGEQERARAYEQLREELRAGRQGYVVCPSSRTLRSPPRRMGARRRRRPGRAARAGAELERLRSGELEGFELVLLHGRCARARNRRR